jgi:hypothetical protein
LQAPPHITRLRTSAIVSPASANSAALVPGNGLPVAGAPELIEAVRPARPWARGGVVFGL